MTSDDYQHVINELQKVIDDTQTTLSRFEAPAWMMRCVRIMTNCWGYWMTR